MCTEIYLKSTSKTQNKTLMYVYMNRKKDCNYNNMTVNRNKQFFFFFRMFKNSTIFIYI